MSGTLKNRGLNHANLELTTLKNDPSVKAVPYTPAYRSKLTISAFCYPGVTRTTITNRVIIDIIELFGKYQVFIEHRTCCSHARLAPGREPTPQVEPCISIPQRPGHRNGMGVEVFRTCSRIEVWIPSLKIPRYRPLSDVRVNDPRAGCVVMASLAWGCFVLG